METADSIISRPLDQKSIEAQNRQPYVAPVLVRYGDVRTLTMNGAPSFTEDQGPGKSGCGKSVAQACPSDRRLKTHIEWVGHHPWGFGLYLFDYRCEWRGEFGSQRQFGVMADEVERVVPSAVVEHPQGYKMVNYEALGIHRTIH